MKVSKSVRMLMGLLACMVLMTSCATNKIKPIEISQTTENVFSTNTINVLVNNEDDAYKALNSVSELYGFNDAKDEFKTERIDSLDTGTYYKFSQLKNGVPVYGKTMIVSADENGNVFNINGNYCSISENISTTPKIDNKKAQKKIEKEIKKELKNGMFVSEPELVIFAGGDIPVLTWKANVAGYTSKDVFEAYEVFAAANTGNILYKKNSIDYAQVQKTETGHNGGQQTITVEENDDNGVKQYQLYDESRGIYVYEPIDKYYWYQNGNAELISWKEGEVPDESGVDALANISRVYDFYNNNLNHKGMDNKGGKIPVFIHITNYAWEPQENVREYVDYVNNACFWGYPETPILAFTEKTKNDGEYSTNLDVVGHEYTHGVIFNTAKLPNGSINEAYADIMGLCIESTVFNGIPDWKIQNLRDVKNPKNNNFPTNMSEYDENKGIYYNSSIISHSAYLMWEGNENSGAIKDTTKLAKLWYDSLYMLNSESNFSDCRTAVEISAQRLHALGILTDEQVKRVSESFNQVGIDPKPLYEIVAVNPELHVYATDNSEYYNYHCKIDKVTLNLERGKFSNPIANKKIDYETIKEFDVTEETTINLENLIEAPSNKVYTYRITISDLSEEPGTTQIKHVTVSHNSRNSLDFYTDFKGQNAWMYRYMEYIASNNDYDKYNLIYIDDDDIPELYLNGMSTAQGDKLCIFDESSQSLYEYDMWIYGLSYIPKANSFLHSGGHMHVYYNKICFIDNYKVVENDTGEYGAMDNSNIQLDQFGEPIYAYKWNDMHVSKSDYEKILDNSFNSNLCRWGGEDAYTYPEIMRYLENMLP